MQRQTAFDLICNIRFQLPFPTIVPWDCYDFVHTLISPKESLEVIFYADSSIILRFYKYQGEKKQDCKCSQTHRLIWYNDNLTTA